MPAGPLVCPGHTLAVPKIAFSAEQEDGLFLASACHDHNAMLRDGVTGDWVGTFEAHRGALWEVSINSEGTRVATGGADFSVRFWDATSGDQLHFLPQDHVAKVAQMYNTSKLLVAGNMDRIRLYDLNSPDAAAQQSRVEVERTRRGIFLPNGDGAITAGREAKLIQWDLRTMDQGTTIELPSPVVDLESVSGMLTVAMKDCVRVYDLSAPSPVMRHEVRVTDDSGKGTVTSASLNPHFGLPGLAQVITAEENVANVGSVCRLWDLNGKLLDTLKGHEKPVLAVRFAPTGTSAASSSEDCTLRIWPLKERAAQRAAAQSS